MPLLSGLTVERVIMLHQSCVAVKLFSGSKYYLLLTVKRQRVILLHQSWVAVNLFSGSKDHLLLNS